MSSIEASGTTSAVHPKGDLAEAFGLPAGAFIAAVATRFGATLDQETSALLLHQMERGRTRMEIFQAVARLTGNGIEKRSSIIEASKLHPGTETQCIENLCEFAPDNDAAFVKHASLQVLDRSATAAEIVQFTHDLKTARIGRLDVLKSLTSLAERDGRRIFWDSYEPSSARVAQKQDLLERGSGRMIDADGRDVFSLVRQTDRGWSIDQNTKVEIAHSADGRWMLNEGLVLAGPKVHMQEGIWKLEIDLLQADSDVLRIDMVANAGVSQMFDIEICGSLTGSFLIKKSAGDLIPEVRIWSPAQKAAQRWLTLRTLQLTKTGAKG